MNKTMRQVLFTTIPILLLLAACAPAPAPTVDPNQINSQIATSVALTVASQNLDTAEAQPVATEYSASHGNPGGCRHPDPCTAPGHAHSTSPSHNCLIWWRRWWQQHE